MKTIAWILFIYTIVSVVYNTKKEGKDWMDPFINEFKTNPIISSIILIILCVILVMILF